MLLTAHSWVLHDHMEKENYETSNHTTRHTSQNTHHNLKRLQFCCHVGPHTNIPLFPDGLQLCIDEANKSHLRHKRECKHQAGHVLLLWWEELVGVYAACASMVVLKKQCRLIWTFKHLMHETVSAIKNDLSLVIFLTFFWCLHIK